MTCWTGFSANSVLANETPGDNREDSIQERRCSKLFLSKEYAMRRRFVAAKEKLLAKLYQGCSLPANYIAAKLRPNLSINKLKDAPAWKEKVQISSFINL